MQSDYNNLLSRRLQPEFEKIGNVTVQHGWESLERVLCEILEGVAQDMSVSKAVPLERMRTWLDQSRDRVLQKKIDPRIIPIRQCLGTCANGKSCRQKARDNSSYCGRHESQSIKNQTRSYPPLTDKEVRMASDDNHQGTISL